MAYSQGIDFRATSGYVTDPARHDCELASVSYPRTTAQGNTVGWETSLPRGARDRLNSVDARLAGIHYVSAPTALSYRFDLPRAGDYNVRLAAGDATTPNPVRVELFDDTTSKGVLANGVASGSNMRDATNTALALSAWSGSNTAVAVTFASTTCRFRVGANSGSDNYVIAHLYVESADDGVTALAGAAQAISSSEGALSVNVPLVSAAVGVATASGALSAALKLSGGAVAVAQASGALALGVVLSGAAIAQSLASGTLASRFTLGGAARAQPGASGSPTVSSQAALAGDVAAHAVATGTLTVQFALSGAAIAQAAVSGALSVGGTSALAGTAQAVSAASGALSVSIPLAGAAQVVAGTTGNLTTGSPLSGAAVAVAAAAGNLTVTVKLSGTAVAQAIASGGLSLRVPLSAAAIAHANASGVLSGGLSPYINDARYTVRARPRNFTVTHAH